MPRRRSRNPVQHESECGAEERGAQERARRRDDQFTVQAEDASFAAPRLVVATGGLSIAKIGATSFGYDLARQFGLKIEPPRAALVPLTFSERGPQALVRFGGSLHRSGCFHSWHEPPHETGVPRKHALHSSRHQRARDSPDLFLLGRQGADSSRPCARPQSHRRFANAWPSRPIELEIAVARRSASPLRRSLARNLSFRPATPIAPWLTPNIDCMRGKSRRKEPRVTEKRKSPRAASIPTNFPPRPWNQEKCPAFFLSEKWSTSPASSAASTSSGRGRPDFAPDRRCEAIGDW